jgi:hypothetical protein
MNRLFYRGRWYTFEEAVQEGIVKASRQPDDRQQTLRERRVRSVSSEKAGSGINNKETPTGNRTETGDHHG